MDAVTYYLLMPVLWLVSRLPFWMLYHVSDAFQLLLFHVVRYRRTVIQRNLQAAFPDMSADDRARLERAFYQHFVDLILETFKELSTPTAAFEARVTYTDSCRALARELRASGQDAIAVMGHLGNWEWAGAAYHGDGLGVRLGVLYAPLHNPYFDRLINDRMRRRHGMLPIPGRQALRAIPAQLGTGTVFLFVADQAAHPRTSYWTRFLNQDTAVFRGPERFAREFDLPVLYFSIHKPRRGRYVVHAEMMVRHPREAAPDAIMEQFVRRLEADVLAQPEIWLWSHRRWKHARPANMDSVS